MLEAGKFTQAHQNYAGDSSALEQAAHRLQELGHESGRASDTVNQQALPVLDSQQMLKEQAARIRAHERPLMSFALEATGDPDDDDRTIRNAIAGVEELLREQYPAPEHGAKIPPEHLNYVCLIDGDKIDFFIFGLNGESSAEPGNTSVPVDDVSQLFDDLGACPGDASNDGIDATLNRIYGLPAGTSFEDEQSIVSQRQAQMSQVEDGYSPDMPAEEASQARSDRMELEQSLRPQCLDDKDAESNDACTEAFGTWWRQRDAINLGLSPDATDAEITDKKNTIEHMRDAIKLGMPPDTAPDQIAAARAAADTCPQ